MNRIAAHFPTQTASSPSPAFLLCPLTLFATGHQQAQVAEVYRIAAERTREQLAAWQAPGIPAFSAN
jgi:hypothetical protein